MENIYYILAKSVTDGHIEVRISYDFDGEEYARERLRLDGLAILRIYDEHEFHALFRIDSDELDRNGQAVREYCREYTIHRFIGPQIAPSRFSPRGST